MADPLGKCDIDNVAAQNAQFGLSRDYFDAIGVTEAPVGIVDTFCARQ